MPVLDLAQRQYGGNSQPVAAEFHQFVQFRLAPTFGYGRRGEDP